MNSPDLGLRNDVISQLSNVSVILHAAGPYEHLVQFASKHLVKLVTLVLVEHIDNTKQNLPEMWTIEDYKKFSPDVAVSVVRLPELGPACHSPFPGFAEKLRGPTALIVGAGFGHGYSHFTAEFVPIDLATNTIIVAARERAVR